VFIKLYESAIFWRDSWENRTNGTPTKRNAKSISLCWGG